ncbi:alpha/beta hydrolase [Kovacikia minuta CCNUW1]|uniref:alpha/beta hydrolase n=1 Tax=Kovacikia minuta TaxID=2931930 RepID=UPI001CCD36A8|nr:alpha/beta hydrolase [Kovacikia minuta]UBF28366.1 alpha/beta hydrolase [Kovacikia minuta CCNUW1]
MVGWLGWLLPGMVLSSSAAERIYVSYSVLERSVSVKSLETYAKQGKIVDEDLAVYAQYANPKELEQLRNVLTSKADVDAVAVSQFLYSPQGVNLLKRFGQVIQPESRQSESNYKAIRAALIGAAVDKEGLTLLNFLRKFPTRGLRVDVERGLEIASTLEKLVNQTRRATAVIIEQSTVERGGEGAIAPKLTEDLRSRGPFRWKKQSLEPLLIDPNLQSTPSSPSRDNNQSLPTKTSTPGRQIQVDIYFPELNQAQLPKKLPVIVISHGLGSDRTAFAYLAQHLASYGFAVLVPEHPGSNTKQFEALLRGVASEVAEPSEFIDRPLDITAVLNNIELRAKSDPSFLGRLNLQQVGVIGQSFGGYTALALGGAPINMLELESGCQDLENTLNLSLLLQCRAFDLKKIKNQTEINLHDSRVKAVIALNPFTSKVFGQTSLNQIKIPTMIVSGNGDTVAPALLEQIQPFTELSIPNKYLILAEGGTHFSFVSGGSQGGVTVTLPPELAGPNPATARRYVNALSVAFFKTYLENKLVYQNYLSATYANDISENALPVSLVRSLTPNQLTQVLESEKNAPVASLSQSRKSDGGSQNPGEGIEN